MAAMSFPRDRREGTILDLLRDVVLEHGLLVLAVAHVLFMHGHQSKVIRPAVELSGFVFARFFLRGLCFGSVPSTRSRRALWIAGRSAGEVVAAKTASVSADVFSGTR